MYGWIWQRLPFGLAGKIVGSVLLASAAGMLLWFVVFPYVDSLAWFNGSQAATESNVSNDPGGGQIQAPSPGASNASDFVPSYSTEHNNTAPHATPWAHTSSSAR